MPGPKRRKIPPKRIGDEAPEWVRRLLEHDEPPADGTPEYEDFMVWHFGLLEVPGLPPCDSYQGRCLLDAGKPVPAWVQRYLETGGAAPPVAPHLSKDIGAQLDWHRWACWAKFGSPVRGLPDPESPEGVALRSRSP